MKNHPCVIGVDFDNTIVTYDDLLHTVAVERGLIPALAGRSKKAIRDHVRQLPLGEIEWQKLQAVVYGPRISEAKLIDGVRDFFVCCRREKVTAFIISHKTEFSGYDETHTNLRDGALGWMAANSFFRANGLGLSPKDVFFCATRREKIERIRQLGCTHFIDDLEEIFLEEHFPTDVEKILFTPCQISPSATDVRSAVTWKDICAYFFGG